MRLAATAAARTGYATTNADASPIPHLRLLSALAEGADRLVAEIALERQFDLVCPLPFAQAEYAKDFASDESKMQFCALLARAIAPPPELDGGRGDDEARSYEAVGRLVVRNCDLLIAIWNGRPGKGLGGTADTVRFATNYGPPVWWVHAEEDKPPVWLTDPQDVRASIQKDFNARAALRRYLISLILPPAPIATHPHTLFERAARLRQGPRPAPFATYRTTQAGPRRRIWRAYAWLIRTVARGAPAPWTPPHRPSDPVARYWFDHYDPADSRAGEYAARYRSAYVLMFGLATIAVAFATVALAVPELKLVMTGLEFLALLLIAVLVLANERLEWHPYSIEYRLLAELCRKQQALAPVCWSLSGSSVRAKLTVPADSAAVDVGETPVPDRAAWVEWLFGALQRAAPLPEGPFGPAMVAAARNAALNDLIEEQLKYHKARQTQSRRAGDAFVRLGELLFFLVLLVVLLKLGLVIAHGTHSIVLGLGLLAAMLPAFSAGFVGIRAYAELPLLADQSRRMHAEMVIAKARVGRLSTAHPLASQELGAEVLGIAMLMLQDVQGWVQLFRAKVVEPG